MNVPFILENHFADCVWTHAGDDASYDLIVDDCGNPLSGLLWGTEDTRQTGVQNPQEKPTLTELQNLWDTQYAVAFENQQARKKRATEYPPIGDQLDALFKAGVFPADMAAAIQAVKDKYPKGTA